MRNVDKTTQTTYFDQYRNLEVPFVDRLTPDTSFILRPTEDYRTLRDPLILGKLFRDTNIHQRK